MTDLANVWVRAARLELVRADRIVSLLIGDPAATGGGPAQMTVLLDRRPGPPGSQLQLMALVAGGDGPREVHLWRYQAGEVVRALAGLVGALAAAAGRSELVLFVCPGPGRGAEVGWEVTTALPREWVGGPGR